MALAAHASVTPSAPVTLRSAVATLPVVKLPVVSPALSGCLPGCWGHKPAAARALLEPHGLERLEQPESKELHPFLLAGFPEPGLVPGSGEVAARRTRAVALERLTEWELQQLASGSPTSGFWTAPCVAHG